MRPAEGEFLRHCLRADPDEDRLAWLLPRCRADRLVEATEAHRVSCTTYPVLAQFDARTPGSVPAEVMAHVRRRRVQMAALWLRMQIDLDFLAEVLGRLGVGWVVLKGPVVAQTLYGSLNSREWSDLDVMVDRHAFGAVIGALEAEGARLVDRNWTMVRHRMQGEMSLELPLGTALDLHWHLLNGQEKRQSFSINVDRMFTDRRTVEVETRALPALDAVDQLLHLCLHACHSGGHRLQWVKDVERAARAVDDWQPIVERAVAWGTGLATALMLDRASTVLGAPVPQYVCASLARGELWRSFGRLANVAVPPQQSHRSRLSGRMLYAQTRVTTRDSWRLARSASGAAWRRDPVVASLENPLHESSGSSADRAAYFAALGGVTAP